MNCIDAVSAFWMEFLTVTNRDSATKYADCYHFDTTEESANELLALVLDGTKKATSSSAAFFEGHGLPLPKAGDFSIVTDWQGMPHCVVETTQVTVLPFREITFELCKREGEDDCLESWREGHIRFFTAEGKAEGYSFSWDMPVVFEDFVVVYRAKPSAD